MILKKYAFECVAHQSYFVADLESGVAAVVDPQPDVDCYLEEAWRLGVEVRHVFLTKFHADFAAGHLALRDRAGAHLYMGAWARAGFGFIPLKTGDVLEFGKVRLEILETPGHALEGISILIHDLGNGDGPPGIFTGDTVLAGDVGRPEPKVTDGLSATELAWMLYDSIRDRFLTLPDNTLVYPSHGFSALGDPGPKGACTVGAQRVHNFAFQPMSRREFVHRITSGMITSPPPAPCGGLLNRGGGAGVSSVPGPLRASSIGEFFRVRGRGVQFVDVRDPADFAGAHLEGSVNIPLSAEFESWGGTVLEPDQPVLLVANPGCEDEAARRLGRIGVNSVAGYLRDGMQGCEGRLDLVRRAGRLTRPALAGLLASPEPPAVVDVGPPAGRRRAAADFRIPLEELWARLEDLPRERMVVVQAGDPYRSSAGASLLRVRGWPQVVDLVGGTSAWGRNGHGRGNGGGR